MDNKTITLIYKENKIGKTVLVPYTSKAAAIFRAKDLFKQGFLSVRVSEVTEDVIFDPHINQ